MKVISETVAAATPTDITVATENTDTSCNVAFFTSDSGDLAPKASSYLTFNSASGVLSTFQGVTTTNGNFTDSAGDLRKIIPNNNLGISSGAWTPNSNHCGHVNYMNRAGGVNITTSSFVDGNIITIVNSGTSDMTITQGTGMTIHFSGDGTSGNRTLAKKGMCNIYFISSTEGYISGAGLT